MPFLSSVLDPAYPLDDRFIPAPEQTTSPDYGFFFDAPYGYASHFNFDRCSKDAVSANPYSGDPEQPPPKLDFNDQNLFYRRLFRLADTGGKPRFYLCPWLIVPFEKNSVGKFTAMIKNDAGGNSVGLRVRPFLKAQPDSVQPATTPSAAGTWIKELAGPRKLTLGTTKGRPAHAKWTKTASADIDEALCADFQDLEITFDEIDETSTLFPYSCDLTITSDQVGCVGQLCLVFVKMIERPTILFRVTRDTLHKVEITQLKQEDADKALNGSNPNNKTGLNSILERCGLRFVSAPSQVKRKGDTNPMTPGKPISFPLGDPIKEMDAKDAQQPAQITTQFLNSIEKIDGISVDFRSKPWRLEQSPYVFVFFMSYVDLNEPDIHMLPVGETAGLANFFSRTAHIFDSTPRTLAHECGHALGLQHSFYVEGETVASAVGFAAGAAEDAGITAQGTLYGFYDDANQRGLREAYTSLLKDENPVKGTRSGTSIKLRDLLSPRRYQKFSNNNLMDYIGKTQQSWKEEVRKDQIEQIRCYF